MRGGHAIFTSGLFIFCIRGWEGFGAGFHVGHAGLCLQQFMIFSSDTPASGIKTAGWPCCLPRLPYRTHFFTVSCIKDFFGSKVADHMDQPLACKSRIGNKDDASQHGIDRILSVMI